MMLSAWLGSCLLAPSFPSFPPSFLRWIDAAAKNERAGEMKKERQLTVSDLREERGGDRTKIWKRQGQIHLSLSDIVHF